MTTNFRVGIGHGLTLPSLALIDPQPASGGIRATQRTYGTSGKVHEMGDFAELVWPVLEDPEDYQDLLEQFGFLSIATKTVSVTVYIPDEDYNYARCNATAVRPWLGQDGEWNNYFLRGITILLKKITRL